jgi:PAS domain S-box-containing protein
MPFSRDLPTLQRRLLLTLGAVWLVAMLIIGGGVAYFVFLTGQQNWLLFGGGMLLVGGVVIGVTAHLVRQYARQLQTALPPPETVKDTPAAPKSSDHLAGSWNQMATQPAPPAIEEDTEYRWTEKKLQEVKRAFNQGSRVTFEGIIIHKKVRVLDADQSLATMFGYEPSEMGGKTVLELSTPEGRGIVLKNTFLRLEEPYQIVGLKKDGSTFPIEILSRAISYQGRMVNVMAVREITGQKQAEILEALQKVKDELEISLTGSTTQLRYSNERLRLELDERMRMETELRDRARQQAAVAELGQRALVGADLSVLMEEAVSLVAETLEVEYAKIQERLPDGKTLLLQAGAGWQEELVGQATVQATTDSQAGYTLLSSGPVIVEDFSQEVRFRPSSLLRQHQVVSSISVIIHSRHNPFGVLGAHTTRQRTFTEDDMHFLQAVANVLAAAIERKRVETQIVRRNRELMVLQSTATAIMSSLDLQHILNTVTEEMTTLLGIDACVIFDWNQADNVISGLAGHGLEAWGTEETPVEVYQVAEFPLAERVLIEQSAWQMSVEQPDINPTALAYMQAHKIKALLMLPMVFQGRVRGLVQIMDCRSERTFAELEISLAQLLTNQAASAIENARLHAETEQRAEQLAVLHELDRAITTSLRLSDIYHAFTHHASRLLCYDRTSIALLEENKMRVTYVADKEGGKITLPEDTVLSCQGSAVGWVAGQGQPLLRHNIAADTRFVEDEELIAGGIQSSMIIPLRVKGQVIGAWNIDRQQVGAYSPDDLEIAQSMADQLAIAIENARLFQQAKQEIAERQRAEAALEEERALLALRVAERTMDLQAANEELGRAARLKDEFLASMSHELRTPLTAILGLAEVLKSEVYGPITEKQLNSISNLEESGRHLLELINDILDLSKVEAGKLELRIELVPIETVCRNSLQFIKQTAHKKNIKVSFTFDDSVSILHVDRRRFKQILVNLLSNAVKFTPEGGEVGLEVVGDVAQKMAHFIIWDTGIGIPQKDMERLFEPFVQLDSKLSRHYSGTGLGLALVYRMVKMHGGEILVESDGLPGQGSRFTISFPWTGPEEAGRTEETKTSVGSDPSIIRQAPTDETESPLILLAEDENTTAKLVADYLLASGYRVIIAHDGVEVLEQAREKKPAVILMDAQMPEMDGLEATRRLRADSELAAIPVIALTALAMSGDRERCLKAGANDYLSKPFDLKRLVQAIESQLEQNAD